MLLRRSMLQFRPGPVATFKVVASPNDTEPDVDIVFVHGFAGNWERSRVLRKSLKKWLARLPADMEPTTTRVSMFGFDLVEILDKGEPAVFSLAQDLLEHLTRLPVKINKKLIFMAHTLGCWVIQKAIAQPLAFKAVDSIAGFIFIAMQDFAATEVLAWEAFRTSTLTYLANRPTEFHRAGGNKDDLEPLSLDNENFRRLLQSLGAEGITEDLTQPWPDETALKVPALPILSAVRGRLAIYNPGLWLELGLYRLILPTLKSMVVGRKGPFLLRVNTSKAKSPSGSLAYLPDKKISTPQSQSSPILQTSPSNPLSYTRDGTVPRNEPTITGGKQQPNSDSRLDAIDASLSLAMELHDAGELDLSRKVYEGVKATTEFSEAVTDLDIIEIDTQVAMITFHQGIFGEAAKMFSDLVGRSRLLPNLDVKRTLDLRYWKALCAQKLGHYDEAAQAFSDILKELRCQNGVHPSDLLRIKRSLALVWAEVGLFTEAEKLGREALKEQQSLAKPSKVESTKPDIATLISMFNLATVLFLEGNYIEAVKMNNQALPDIEMQLGTLHIVTLDSARLQTRLLAVTGETERAEEQCQRVLRDTRMVLGPHHPLTLKTLSILVSIYLAQARWRDAEDVAKDVLAQNEAVLSPNHPQTLASRSDLAAVHHACGFWREAEAEQREVVDRMASSGSSHRNISLAKSVLAPIVFTAGYWHEARQLAKAGIWDRRGNSLLENADQFQKHEIHLTSLGAMEAAGVMEREFGEFYISQAWLKEALSSRKHQFGPEHNATISALFQLAITQRELGRIKEAAEDMRQVLASKNQILGKTHPETLSVRHQIAVTDRQLGNLDGAEHMEVEVLRERVRILGLKHPDIPRTVVSVAMIYQSQGRLSEAEELMHEALDLQIKIFHPSHPEVHSGRSNLAMIYFEQGRLEEAEQLLAEVLGESSAEFRNEHYSVSYYMDKRALICRAKGDLPAAKNFSTMAEEGLRRLLGPTHPYTLSSMLNLASTCWALKEYEDAERIQRKVLAIQEGQLGRDRPEIQLTRYNLAWTLEGQGRTDDAQKLREEVAKIQEESWAARPPDSSPSKEPVKHSDLQMVKDILVQADGKTSDSYSKA